MQRLHTTLGGLKAQVLDAASSGQTPELLVILCHGYGAPGDDLVPLGGELFASLGEDAGKVRLIFPEAPMDLADQGMPGGRAWWTIDMMRLMVMQQDLAAGIARMQEELPAELPRARKHLLALIDEATRPLGLPTGKVVLGGFSQGAMLATDVALRLEEPPAALCIFSGSLINKADWTTRAAARRGLEVLQSHGTIDPILPYANAEALRELLVAAGAQVTFTPFRGGHTIPLQALEQLAELLRRKLTR